MFIGKEGIHTDDNQFYIADITNYIGGIDFNLGYRSGYSFTDEIAEINMTAVNSTELDDKCDLKELEALREAKENLFREIVLKTAQSGAVLGLSYIAPEIAIFARSCICWFL